MEIIWGITVGEVWLLLKQVGLAIVGAASLWGFVFSIRDRAKNRGREWIIDDLIGMKIFNLYLGGVLLSVLAYFLSIPSIRTLAHEGIAVAAGKPEVDAALPILFVLFIILLLLSQGMILLRRINEEKFSNWLTPFYAVSFLLALVMTSFSVWRGILDSTQIFHFIHGFHSVFTLGSVIVLDFLFLTSARSLLLKEHVYSLFPTITKVILFGLSLDFLSVFLITDSFVPTEKFLFVQTVISILVINGVILAGPIARKMTEALRSEAEGEPSLWRRAGGAAGVVSITSWLTITSLDFFRNLTLGYGEMLLVYLSVIVIAYFAREIIESRAEKEPAPTLA